MFLMSVSLARPQLDEAFPYVSQLGQSTTVCQRAGDTPSAGLLAAPPHLTTFPAQCRCALQRGHVELLQHVFHVRRVDSEFIPLLRSYQGSAQVARWFRRHLAALAFQVSFQHGEDFCDSLARSSQQLIVVEHTSDTRLDG